VAIKEQRTLRFGTLFGVAIAISVASVVSTSADSNKQDGIAQVVAKIETEPVATRGDAADDPAIWVHPTKPELSTVIGTDKDTAGLGVYDLSGRQIQFVRMTGANNVDLRDNVLLGDARVTLVVATNPADNSLEFFQVNADSRKLSPVPARNNKVESDAWGVCLYRAARTGRLYVFNIARKGHVEQWEISGAGKFIALKKVRSVALDSGAEGCVADDETGALYVSEEKKGIWRFGAEPAAGRDGRLIDSSEPGSGNLHADVEGLTIYDAGGKNGYLIASSQGDDRYVVYDRVTNKYVSDFMIGSGPVDGVSNTDGIEVTNRPLGSLFPHGLFVVQDGRNRDAYIIPKRQNFKLVPWETIATKFRPELKIRDGQSN
jgi:3-phytase